MSGVNMIEQITYYVQGRLSEEESIEFWKQLIFSEEDLELLEFYILLRKYFSESFNNEPNIPDSLNSELALDH